MVAFMVESEVHKFNKFLHSLENNLETLKDKPSDFLEQKWCELVGANTRKIKGQIPTPLNIARFMARWAIQNNNFQTILDPAVGCGIFFEQILKLLPLNQNKSNLTFHGYDIDPLMVKASNLRLRDTKFKTKIMNLDFILQTKDFYYDIIIGNPPYIKSNQIKNKKAYYDQIKAQFGVKLDGTTGLDAIFFLQSIDLLKKNGKIIFITPSEFLNSGYGHKIKDILLKKLKIEAFIYFDSEEFPFQEGMSSALITLATKQKQTLDYEIKLVTLKEWPDDEILLSSLNHKSFEPPNSLITIKKSELQPEEKWIPKFVIKSFYSALMKNFIPLSTFFNVKRGIATGDNSFFTLTKEETFKWNIDNKYLKPVLTKASFATPPVFTENNFEKLVKEGKKTILLDIKETNPSNIKSYLDYGIKKGVDQRYLTKNRKKWFFIEHRNPSKILIKVFSRGSPQFILNETSALNLTCFHGLNSIDQSEKFIKPLLLFLVSKYGQESIKLQLRHYGGGLKKMEPRDVENILIPDFRILRKEEIDNSDDLFIAWVEGKELSSSLMEKINDFIKTIIENLRSRLNSNESKKALFKYLQDK
jgi:adenine-specific DNA-methyltransferase